MPRVPAVADRTRTRFEPMTPQPCQLPTFQLSPMRVREGEDTADTDDDEEEEEEEEEEEDALLPFCARKRVHRGHAPGRVLRNHGKMSRGTRQ